MKFLSALTTALLSTAALAKNIVLTNDDGWASTEIRATYRELTNAGHNVYLVAPLEQRSGFGGTFTFSYTDKLLHDDQFHFKKEGDAAWGHEENDDHIWYFNATPAACVGFAFDYLLPTHFADVKIDLVVSGVNQGLNLDIPMFTISGTIGATYNAVYRGYSAVAFSGSTSNNSFYQDSLNDDSNAPANIYAKKVVEITSKLFESQGDNERVLPLGTGLNVNFPKVTTLVKEGSEECSDPQFVFSRLTGEHVAIPGLKLNETSGVFEFSNLKNGSIATGVKYNGIFDLPSENSVTENGCWTSVSAFSVDYSAPEQEANEAKALLGDLLVQRS
ncbi:5'-nucleotidase surE [Wickerhamomyces ciferrii]|uniref:5'-nucleotidase surE n=1 Tax=Wickerhamomyces ciferrii (strain ATCC 14091 / BCRC 22168 / CBS 111 / JCM 3599 / NBRC 0793 / NRRL Y-1031 F-60-10) TaxID=1206466 RepID=K0KEY2_WICCF|nr:5'-nucleotidase surE [Wickerhamomyces ciferrii]CCH43695.1 5'-nucleotidase surE [Wickerhamomyces ciferrii]